MSSDSTTPGAWPARVSFLLGSTGLAVLFVAVPDIDLWFSDLFYEPGRGFYLNDAWWVQLFFHLVPLIVIILSLTLIASLLYTLIWRRPIGLLNRRAILFLLAALALGPGLVVQTLLKDQWGRARPRDVAEFGGSRRFTPAFVISDQCDRNCSFVAGHPSVPYYFMCLGLLWWRRRRWIYLGAAAAGGLVGLGRILQGAHFLSDVVYSGVFTFLVAYLLYYYVFRLQRERRPAVT